VDAGTDLFVMMQVGASMQEFRVGTAGYLVVGETIIGTIFGEAIHGTIIISLMPILIETGEPGIIPAIGIDRNIDNLHITMMEGCTVGVYRIGVVLIKIEDEANVTLTKVRQVLDRGALTKAPQGLDRLTLIKVQQVLDRGALTKVPHRGLLTEVVPQLGKERLEQVGTVLQVRTSIAQVKPIEVNILTRQKERGDKV